MIAQEGKPSYNMGTNSDTRPGSERGRRKMKRRRRKQTRQRSTSWQELLTTKELADKLRVSTKTVYRLMKKDPLFPHMRVGRSHPLFDLQEVLDYLSTAHLRPNELGEKMVNLFIKKWRNLDKKRRERQEHSKVETPLFAFDRPKIRSRE